MNNKVQDQLEKLEKRKKDYHSIIKILKLFSFGFIFFEIVALIIFYLLFSDVMELFMAWSVITPVAIGTIFFMSWLEKKNIEYCEKYLCRKCGVINRENAIFCDNCSHQIKID